MARLAAPPCVTFLFVLYRPGKALCVPYEAIPEAALLSRRTVADNTRRNYTRLNAFSDDVKLVISL
jgi:hypothetical protein